MGVKIMRHQRRRPMAKRRQQQLPLSGIEPLLPNLTLTWLDRLEGLGRMKLNLLEGFADVTELTSEHTQSAVG